MDRYSIPVRSGRAMALSASQLRQIATGLGLTDFGAFSGDSPRIVRALLALPVCQRADAVQVAQLRFGGKQDVESIATQTGLNPWQVWQLETAFLRALEAEGANVARAAQAIV